MKEKVKKGNKTENRDNKGLNKTKLFKGIFVGGFVAVSLIPLVFMDSNQVPIGNEVKAETPKLTVDGGLNPYFTTQVQDYFAKKFGFRNKLVMAGNALKESAFKTSGSSEVIVGESDWLFYGRALDNFTGENRLSDVQIRRLACIVSMMSEYVESQGSDFIFFSAPNKMSIYGEYMPYYYLEYKGISDYDRLFESLHGTPEISTVNVKNALFGNKLNYLLYHKKDSHWNNYGAAVAYDFVIEKLNERYAGYEGSNYCLSYPFTVRNDFLGDLEQMLVPGAGRKDAQVYFDYEETYEYVSRFKSPEDLVIDTQNSQAAIDKSVAFYRDSFGNAMYAFVANDFSEAHIQREFPYDLYQTAGEYDLVMIELVERNLKNLLVNPPVVPSADLMALNTDISDVENMDFEVDAQGNIEINEEVDGITARGFGAFFEEGLYKVEICSDYINDTVDAMLVLRNGSKDEAAYKLIPSGEDCEYSVFLETVDYERLMSSKAEAYIVCDKNGVVVSMPADMKFQEEY